LITIAAVPCIQSVLHYSAEAELARRVAIRPHSLCSPAVRASFWYEHR
jgi:hypothetical protein